MTTERDATTGTWPLEAVLHVAFERRPLPAKVKFQLALRRIEGYVLAAQRQAARLDIPVTEYLKQVAVEEPTSMPEWPGAQLLADAHFYFICWDSVAKDLASLRANPAGLTTPRQVWRKYRKLLERYQTARDHLEHYSERLPLGKHSRWSHERNEGTEAVSGDPGAVRLGSIFTINGEEWDLSLEGAKALESLWKDLIEGLRDETAEKFAAWVNGKSARAEGS